MPARASRVARRTPFHRAVPTAPFSHWMPATGGSKKARPLPAHSRVIVTVAAGSFLISSSESESGVATLPSSVSFQAAASSVGGTGRCDRT